MKYFELDKNEKAVLKDFEQDKLKKVPNAKKEVLLYKEYARQTLNKTKNINIRLSHKDLQGIKTKAIKKGIPYQTLISSLLHQYSGGIIRDGE